MKVKAKMPKPQAIEKPEKSTSTKRKDKIEFQFEEFYTDIHNLKKDLAENGVAVLRVMSEKEVEKILQTMWSNIEEMLQKNPDPS